MIPFPKISPLLSASALAVAALMSPLTAHAQDLATNAPPGAGSNDQSVVGRIQSIDGKYHLTVLDQRGIVDSVDLHQGTVINPTGLSLATGMSVTISGYPAGSSFSANEVDTPYTYDGPDYYAPGSAYDFGFSYGNRPFFHGHEGGFYGGGFHGGGGHR